jgi:uncharacterized membrane protein
VKSILAALAVMAAVIVIVYALVSALHFGRDRWEAIGESKLMWLALQVLMPLLGGLLYLGTVRSRLIDAGGRTTG